MAVKKETERNSSTENACLKSEETKKGIEATSKRSVCPIENYTYIIIWRSYLITPNRTFMFGAIFFHIIIWLIISELFQFAASLRVLETPFPVHFSSPEYNSNSRSHRTFLHRTNKLSNKWAALYPDCFLIDISFAFSNWTHHNHVDFLLRLNENWTCEVSFLCRHTNISAREKDNPSSYTTYEAQKIHYGYSNLSS